MSEPQLWLDPGGAHRGARDLAAAGRDITGARDRLGAQIAAASGQRPWGGDDIGAAVETNYREVERALLAAWSNLGTYVEELGEAAATAVDRSVRTDAHSGRRVRGAYRGDAP